MMGVGISDRQVFGELCVRAEMPSVGGAARNFCGPFAINVTPVATDTANNG